MAWRDNLQPASFRGVPFFVESHDMSGGRRAVQHEYVQRDNPYAEDTGRKARDFSIEAYIVDQNYFALRDSLLAALEKEGPGELVHPYLGRLQVQPTTYRVRETKSDGGMVTFSLGFIEAGLNIFPGASIDNRRSILDEVFGMIDKAQGEMNKILKLVDKPQFMVDSSVGKVNDIADILTTITGKFVTAEQSVAETIGKINYLKNFATTLVKDPLSLGAAITDAFRTLKDSVTTGARDQYKAFQSLFVFGQDDKPIPPITTTRVQEAANLEVLNRFTQMNALGMSIEAASEIPFESVLDASDIREEITFNIERQEELTTDDDLFQQLQDVKTEVIRGVPPPEEQLPTIGDLKINEASPSLVITYDLYNSTEFEQDLIDRNDIQHPGFFPSNQELEILEIEQ